MLNRDSSIITEMRAWACTLIGTHPLHLPLKIEKKKRGKGKKEEERKKERKREYKETKGAKEMTHAHWVFASPQAFLEELGLSFNLSLLSPHRPLCNGDMIMIKIPQPLPWWIFSRRVLHLPLLICLLRRRNFFPQPWREQVNGLRSLSLLFLSFFLSFFLQLFFNCILTVCSWKRI